MPWSYITELWSGQHQSSGAGASQPQESPQNSGAASSQDPLGIQAYSYHSPIAQQNAALQQSYSMAQQLSMQRMRREYPPVLEYGSSSQRSVASFAELFINIGSMACSVGANITTIMVDRETYARIMRDFGALHRDENSDNLAINTAMGQIRICCDYGDKNSYNRIDLSAYMEDVG